MKQETAKVKFLDSQETTGLEEVVTADGELKEWLVNYVGEKAEAEEEVTVEMIVGVMADEFPEFVLALAEENWVRGYQQAFYDLRGDLEKNNEQTELP
tara:strand:- start:376 stop:669 length:294 start_codon:yes stop_codon:yes gene_type:complete